MPQITARVPERLLREIDRAARRLERTRADLIRSALECCMEDVEDLRLGLAALQDPADAMLDWKKIRRDLLCQDQGECSEGARPVSDRVPGHGRSPDRGRRPHRSPARCGWLMPVRALQASPVTWDDRAP